MPRPIPGPETTVSRGLTIGQPPFGDSPGKPGETDHPNVLLSRAFYTSHKAPKRYNGQHTHTSPVLDICSLIFISPCSTSERPVASPDVAQGQLPWASGHTCSGLSCLCFALCSLLGLWARLYLALVLRDKSGRNQSSAGQSSSSITQAHTCHHTWPQRAWCAARVGPRSSCAP